MASEVRLQKVLAQAGLASRREAERLIAAGRVRVNGKVVTAMGQLVDPARDEISLDGKRLGAPPKLVYLMLNKPEGYLVSRGDTHDRPTIYELIGPGFAHLHQVGRLDGNSAGLLLLTNDGELTQHLLHPRHHVEKRYRVRVRGAVRPEHITRLAAGIELDDGLTQPAGVKLLKPLARGAWIEFRLREGRNRQIRRMCEAMGWEVERLERLQLGRLKLGTLSEGSCRLLTQHEVEALRRDAGLPEASPARKTERQSPADVANKASAQRPPGPKSARPQAGKGGPQAGKSGPPGRQGKSRPHQGRRQS